MTRPQTKEEWKTYLKSRLDMSQFLSLATRNENEVWTSPLYFAYDNAFTLYFISEKSSQHVRNLERTVSISCAIYSTSQKPGEDVVGIQMTDKAYAVNDEEREHAREVYFSATDARRPVAYGEFMEPTGEWHYFKIVPNEIFTLDSEIFGEKRIKLPLP